MHINAHWFELIWINRIHTECVLNRFALNANWTNPPSEVVWMWIASGLDKFTWWFYNNPLACEPIPCLACVKTQQKARQHLYVREHFNINQFKGYKVILYRWWVASWNVEETTLITNSEPGNAQSWSIGLIYCSNFYHLLCMAQSANDKVCLLWIPCVITSVPVISACGVFATK